VVWNCTFFIGFGFVIAGSSPSWLALSARSGGHHGILVGLAVLCFGIGGFLFYRHIKTKHKNNYWLCFTTNAGHSRVKGWQDEQFALNISRAINQAMMYG
tara:strand:+ start:240 stop:539 length:300 start_codon:yes stop_codon:yes gene_type:complete